MVNPLADIDNICFGDTETRAEDGSSPSDGNVKTAGTYRYAKHAFVIISTFAIGGAGPVFDCSLDRGFDGDWLCWDELPTALREFHKRVEQREAWYAFFNAGFDRNVWNNGTADWPLLEPDMVIDIMAQGTASNLAPNLEGMARNLKLAGKQDDGKKLINQFCRAGGDTPQSHEDDWGRFKSYGLRDAALLREIFRHTRALPLEEWEDYWISEKINGRGIGIDLKLAERAAQIAVADVTRINAQLTRWTNGQITAVTQAKRIAEWVFDALEYSEARMMLVSEWDEGESEDDLVVGKLSLDRDRIGKVLAFFASREALSERDQLIVDILTARQFGGSNSPFKFQKMLDQHDGGRLKGQYVFNGAQQTGRFSSKGVQVHNLTRSTLDAHEVAAIEMIHELEI